jgi:hypothetical protein
LKKINYTSGKIVYWNCGGVEILLKEKLQQEKECGHFT